MQSRFKRLRYYDKDLFTALSDAAWRVESCLDLRASANHVSPEVKDALGGAFDIDLSLMGGNEFETLAVRRARQLFNADYACVTPTSVGQAVAFVCGALLKAGDSILSLGWVGGDHAVSSRKFAAAGNAFNCSFYDEPPQAGLDLDAVERKVLELRPRMLVVRLPGCGYPVDYLRLRAIADSGRAYLLVDFTLVAGAVAAGICLSPLPFFDLAVASTDSSLRGPEGAVILARANRLLQQKLDAAASEQETASGASTSSLAAKALCLNEAMAPSFRSYQVQVLENARAVAGAFACRGYPLLSSLEEGGPVLVDLAELQVEPERVERVLRRSGICVDIGIWSGREEPGASRSGYLQIGTAAITTRGLGPHHCAEVAGWICDILDHPDAIKVEAFVTHRLARMCARYPVYSEPSLIPF